MCLAYISAECTKSLYMFLVNDKTSTARQQTHWLSAKPYREAKRGYGENYTQNCNQDSDETHNSPETQARTVARIQETPLGIKPPFVRTRTSAMAGYGEKFVHVRL
jgi:hypothetical protein